MLPHIRKRTADLACLVLAAGVVCGPAPARADIAMSMHMSIDMPALRQMPADKRAAMDKYLSSTIYIHGKKFRYDNALVSVIVDRQAMTTTTVNKLSKSYSVTPFDPSAARMMMPGGSLSSAGPLKGYKMADEGNAGVYLGHKVRRYLLTEQLALPNAGSETIRATILSAQDLAPADMASYASLSSSMPGKAHMNGFPLKMSMTMTGGSMGTMTMAMQATSISTSPIPASVFEVPAGYTQMPLPDNPQTTAPPSSGNSGTANPGASGSNNGQTGGNAPGSAGATGGNGEAQGGGQAPKGGNPASSSPPT